MPRYELAMSADGEVPRFDAHQVVKGELQDQPPFRAHLVTTTTVEMRKDNKEKCRTRNQSAWLSNGRCY